MHRRSFLASLLLIASLVVPLRISGQVAGPPNFEGFDNFVEQVMKELKVPGLAIAVVKDGKVIYAKGFGYRDVEKGLRVTPDTLFAIGSCSKAFTAAALGILVDEKKIEWDKPVRQYMPDFMLYDEYATAHLSPRDLVTHQSGLPRHDLVWYGSPVSRKELYERLRYLEPSRQLHAKFQYNNLMFMTAGLLVERASGSTWEQFVRTRILDPLGMKNTNFSVNDSQKAEDFAVPYDEIKGEIKRIPFRNIDAIGPAGSINSSVNEMSNWIMMQLSNGKFDGKQVVPEAALKETQTPQIVAGGELRYDEDFYSSYGMGWGVTSFRGHLLLAHSGGIDGFISQVRLLPRDKAGIVILTNSASGASGVIANDVADRLLGAVPAPWAQRAKDAAARSKEAQAKQKAASDSAKKQGTQTSHPIKDYAGQYEHPAYGVVNIALQGEQLTMNLHGLWAPLKHYHYDIFEADAVNGLDGQKVTFLTNKAGEIDRVAIGLEPSVKDIVFTRKKDF